MSKINEHLLMIVRESMKEGITGKSTIINLYDQEYYITFDFRKIDKKLVNVKYKIEKAETPKEFFKVFEDYAKEIGFNIQDYSDRLKKRFDKTESQTQADKKSVS